MTRHDTHDGRAHARGALRSPWSQTVAASALAGSCVAVVTLWKSAGNRGTGSGDR